MRHSLQAVYEAGDSPGYKSAVTRRPGDCRCEEAVRLDERLLRLLCTKGAFDRSTLCTVLMKTCVLFPVDCIAGKSFFYSPEVYKKRARKHEFDGRFGDALGRACNLAKWK